MGEPDRDGPPPDPLAIRRRNTPQRVGVIDAETGREWSYAALDDGADAVTRGLVETLDSSPETIGLVLGSRPDVLSLAFGGMRAGADVGLLDVNLDEGSLADRLDGLDPDLLVCEADTESVARAVAPCPVASVDRSDAGDVRRLDPFDGPSEARHPDADALGDLVAFTSGTTGGSKGVRLPIETLVASALASALRLGVAADDRWLVPIPTYHVGGFSPFVRCLQAGTTVVLQRTFDADETVTAIDRLDVTCVSLVPTQVSRLLDAGWSPPEALRFALVGGGPVSRSLVERCVESGVPICPTYGATETASQVATATTETALVHPGTVGRPLAFTRVSILDDGQACSPDEIGELVVDGPTVAAGYLGDPDSATFAEDGFHTGDLVRADEAGRLWIEGRADDRIVTGGENVVASTVVSAIETTEGVEAASVVGVEDEEWGQRVCALVVAEGDVDADAVRAHCRERLPPYAVPKTVAFADALPRTPSGTVDRTAVERRLS